MSLLTGRVCRTASSLCVAIRSQQPCCHLSSSAALSRRRATLDVMDLPPPYLDAEWRIGTALCLARPPTLSQPVAEIRQDFLDVTDKIEDENAIPSLHDERMRRFVKLRKALEQRAAGETVTEFTNQELTGDEIQFYEEVNAIEEKERSEFTPAERLTQDDKDNVLTSSNRCLDRYLYLLVRHKDPLRLWTFPQADACGTIGLQEEAAKIGSTFSTPKLDFSVYSNAPSGVLTIRDRKEDGKRGIKVFVYMGLVKGSTAIKALNDPDYEEYRWVPKEEIRSLMLRPQYNGISGMLLS